MNFYTPLSLGLLTLSARDRLYVLFEILRHIKRENSAAGVEPLLASAVNATWPLLSVEGLETIVAIAKRRIAESTFATRHATSVSDATSMTTTYLAPGELQRIDVSQWIDEWRLQPTRNFWGVTDAAANGLLGRLGFGGGPAGTFGSWGGPGLPGANGDFGYGAPGGFGDILGRLGFGGGPAGTFGKWGGSGLPGSNGDFGYGAPGGLGDILGRLGFGGGPAGAFGKWGGPGLPGGNGGFGAAGGPDDALGRIGLSRGPFGAFDPGINGGATGFGAGLGQSGAMHPEGDGFGHHLVDFAKSTWQAVTFGTAGVNAAGKLFGESAAPDAAKDAASEAAKEAAAEKASGPLEVASKATALVILSLGGAYLVGSALAAAEDASDEATKKAWVPSTPVNPGDGQQGGGQQGSGQQGGGQQGGGQQGGGEHGGHGGPDSDPKKHREGDSYPDPDGSGVGPVDPTWIPVDDGPGSGGGNPLWSPAYDGDEPPDPTMIWDENGGGGTPNTTGRGVVLELVAGKGLLAGVVQVGPRTFQLT
ncbi:hypothetical protein [Microvirga rosea]|uniref:hypothetical protein n=1 Tax=Microvirga rosea TaxID=2715425 RepID=UPI001D0AB6E4|nr:hypothetical protein [Microvirga rosea]MCB8823192.1 hypothetical protein [Microvirga rosea]